MFLTKKNKIMIGVILSLCSVSLGINGYDRISEHINLEESNKSQPYMVSMEMEDENYAFPSTNNIPVENDEMSDTLGGMPLTKKILGDLEERQAKLYQTIMETTKSVQVMGDSSKMKLEDYVDVTKGSQKGLSLVDDETEERAIRLKKDLAPQENEVSTLEESRTLENSDKILKSSSIISLASVDKFIDEHPQEEEVQVNPFASQTMSYFNSRYSLIYPDAFRNPNFSQHVSLGYASFMMPATGPITSMFGYRTHPVLGGTRYHSGVDIAVDYGTPILASNFGIVTEADYDGGFGNKVVISHGNGVETLYGHNSKLLVEEGEFVHQGQAIALAGSTGLSTGPHCHFTMKIDGELVDPLDYVVR